MIRLFFILSLFILLLSCKAGKGILGNKSLHEQYGQKLTEAGLHETAFGRQWFSAAEKALASPLAVTLPYKEVGYFPAERPRAVGLKFSGKRGEKILFEIAKNPGTGFTLFIELWRINESGKPTLLASLDSTKKSFEQDVEKDETFILRLQPGLLESGDYTLSVSIGPSLSFPVPGGKIGSVWGDEREGGRRSHEGIDIFAPKRTPTVAAADGTVTSVRNGGLGGKVIFMRPAGKDYTLYYAHLDEQLVADGQRIKAGDTIGLVGNTGNAATTPPHLHFGIYTFGGAINPLPFINPDVKNPADVSVNSSRLMNPFRTIESVKLATGTLNTNLIVYPLAATARTFRVELPNGTTTEIPITSAQVASIAIKQAKIKGDAFLLASPHTMSPKKLRLNQATTVKVMGYFDDFAFVEVLGEKGWLPAPLL